MHETPGSLLTGTVKKKPLRMPASKIILKFNIKNSCNFSFSHNGPKLRSMQIKKELK